MPEVALPLALFGVIATTLPALAIGGLLPSLAVPSGVLSAILMASFVLLAFYMACNALIVRVDRDAIVTERVLFGIVARRRKILRSDIASIDAEIASRYQSLFSSDPVYQLVARDERHHKRVIVAETLKGEALMNEVKAVIDPPKS
jgi:hypothetical protein